MTTEKRDITAPFLRDRAGSPTAANTESSFMEVVSEVNTAYRHGEALKTSQAAFVAFVKHKQQKGYSPEQIETKLKRFLSTAFPDRIYEIKLNWETDEEGKISGVNRHNPFFLTPKDHSLSQAEIDGINALEEGWEMWTECSYEEWRKWYIYQPKVLTTSNPMAPVILPVILPLIYHVPRLFLSIKNSIMSKFNDTSVKQELALETLRETPTETGIKKIVLQHEMEASAAKLHFMRTLFINDYHEDKRAKFSNQWSTRVANLAHAHRKRVTLMNEGMEPFESTSVENPPQLSLAHSSSPEEPVVANEASAQKPKNYLQEYKIGYLALAGMVLMGFVSGFFMSHVNAPANPTFVGSVASSGLLTVAAALTAVGLVVSVAGGIGFAYYVYKKAKKINKQIDSLDEEYLAARQVKKAEKIAGLQEEWNSVRSTVQALEKGEKKEATVKLYRDTLQRKEAFIEKRRMLAKERKQKKENLSLEKELSELSEQRKTLEGQKKQALEAYKRLIAEERGDESKLKAQETKIENLQGQIDSLQRQIVLREKQHKEENSFYEQFRDFICDRDYLSFLTVFLRKDDEFYKINETLKGLEALEEVKRYKTGLTELTSFASDAEDTKTASQEKIQAYKDGLERKKDFIQQRKMLSEGIRAAEQLERDVSDLVAHTKALAEKIEVKRQTVKKREAKQDLLSPKVNNSEGGTSQEKKQYQKLASSIAEQNAEISSLQNELETTQNLLAFKLKRHEKANAKLKDVNINEETSFYTRFRDFICEHDYLSFLAVFLRKEDEFYKLNEALKALEKSEEVKFYRENKKRETMLRTEIEKEGSKISELQDRYKNYNSINQKLAKKDMLCTKMKTLNDNYTKYVQTKLLNEATSVEQGEAIKKTLLSEKMKNPNLHTLDYQLRYKQIKKPKSVVYSAFVNIKRSMFGPRKETTPCSVEEAFKNLGGALWDDFVDLGTNLYDWFDAASTGNYIFNIVGLGVLIGGAVIAASTIGPIVVPVVGTVFLLKLFYERYRENQDAVRDTFLNDPKFAEYVIDEHIKSLEEFLVQCELRDRKVVQLKETLGLTQENVPLEEISPWGGRLQKLQAGFSSFAHKLSSPFFSQKSAAPEEIPLPERSSSVQENDKGLPSVSSSTINGV